MSVYEDPEDYTAREERMKKELCRFCGSDITRIERTRSSVFGPCPYCGEEKSLEWTSGQRDEINERECCNCGAMAPSEYWPRKNPDLLTLHCDSCHARVPIKNEEK